MQTTTKKTNDKLKKDKELKNDKVSSSLRKSQDEKLLKSTSSTPRNYVQKSSTDDIYGKRKTIIQSARSLKKTTSSTDLAKNLKSTPSSVSQISSKSHVTTPKIKKVEAKTSLDSARKTPRSLPLTNVVVNSPISKKKLSLNRDSEKVFKKIDSTQDLKPKRIDKGGKGDSKDVEPRQRTKTRTLGEDEVKVLVPDAVDNNAEMQNLSKRLSAKPKTFYVDLADKKITLREHSKERKQASKVENIVKPDKASDEEISYEDDFESYESDFDSYHSDGSKGGTSNGEQESIEDESSTEFVDGRTKEVKDEEKMLDSGSYDLRDQRSANRTKPSQMEFILEDSEDTEDKKTSFTDEGFQEMSSSSAVSSMRHVEVVERPLFINFSKSKENKRKKKLSEYYEQRAKDLLSMISLHEMSYSLFEMKPIPYDLYMATFGRANYTQTAVQTFDDGITQEVQTEEILCEHKWTQHPVEFSSHDVYLNVNSSQKYSISEESYLSKFTFLINKNTDVETKNKINLDKDYVSNPLRIYFEQKDGVGSCQMLPYEVYKSKLENKNFNAHKLSKFLKKSERRICNILSLNDGDQNMTNLSTNTKLPFSKGYISISPENLTNTKAKIDSLIFSETKSNLLLTIHPKISKGVAAEKCIVCLWDISVTREEPEKILIAVDNVTIGRFRGGTDGIFVAALEDGSLHLWDLSEEPTWRDSTDDSLKITNWKDIKSDRVTQSESEREWNRNHNHQDQGNDQPTLEMCLQSCAYTNSAANMSDKSVTDCTVGLEFVGTMKSSQDSGQKIVGQVCTLLRIGTLTIWSIVQEKKSIDIGKAYWSKMKLEKSQTISLSDHIETSFSPQMDSKESFSLNAAKKRCSNRRFEKNLLREISRQKSSEFERPASSSVRKMLPVKNNNKTWENGIICCDLKIAVVDKKEKYLVAKNCGEVLCCVRNAGGVKISRFSVTTDTSIISCLATSPHGLPYFLAASDNGTASLCSLVDARVLLTLDCRNGPPSEMVDKVTSDNKGRYVSSKSVRSTPQHHHSATSDHNIGAKLSVVSIQWCSHNPLCIFTLLDDGSVCSWDLTHSDICARSVTARAFTCCECAGTRLALITSEGEVQVHRLGTEQRNNPYLDIFTKYVTLL